MELCSDDNILYIQHLFNRKLKIYSAKIILSPNLQIFLDLKYYTNIIILLLVI